MPFKKPKLFKIKEVKQETPKVKSFKFYSEAIAIKSRKNEKAIYYGLGSWH